MIAQQTVSWIQKPNEITDNLCCESDQESTRSEPDQCERHPSPFNFGFVFESLTVLVSPWLMKEFVQLVDISFNNSHDLLFFGLNWLLCQGLTHVLIRTLRCNTAKNNTKVRLGGVGFFVYLLKSRWALFMSQIFFV